MKSKATICLLFVIIGVSGAFGDTVYTENRQPIGVSPVAQPGQTQGQPYQYQVNPYSASPYGNPGQVQAEPYQYQLNPYGVTPYANPGQIQAQRYESYISPYGVSPWQQGTVEFLNGQPNHASLHDFSGGMNTNSSMWLVQPNQGTWCENFRLDDPVGALTVRRGYRDVATFSTYEGIKSLVPYRSISDRVYLFADRINIVVTPPITTAQIVRAGPNTLSTAAHQNRASKLYYATSCYNERSNYVSWFDRLYRFGVHSAPKVIYDIPASYFTVEPMVIPAPGQPYVTSYAYPGTLNGTYIYAFQTETPNGTAMATKRTSIVSNPITVSNEQVGFENFALCAGDSMGTNTGAQKFLLLRTRANCLNPETDSLFVVDSISTISTADCWTYFVGGEPTTTKVDSLGDANLTGSALDSINVAGGRYWGLLKYVITPTLAQMSWTRASTNTAHVPGAPTLIYSDSGSNADTVLGKYAGTSVAHIGNLYAVSYLDTLSGRESPIGAPLCVYRDATVDKNLTLGLPGVPDDAGVPRTNWVRVLYRAKLDQDVWWDLSGTGWHKDTSDYYTFYALDTVTNPAQMVYWDTMGFFSDTILNQWGTDINNEELRPGPFSANFAGGIIHDARMWCWYKDRLYWSKTDTATFAELDNLSFDDGGGDIVGVASFEGYLVVYKEGSVWIVYTQAGYPAGRQKRSGGYGMVSYATLGNYRGANIYLSQGGVVFESDSRYRENVADRGYISDPIRNLLVRDLATMKTAVGKVIPNEDLYLLCYPGTDTIFTYSFLTGGWSIWTGWDFYDGCIYDSNSVNFEDFYFTRPDDSMIYVFGADTTDNDSTFVAVWEKDYISPSLMAQYIDQLHIWKDVVDTTNAAEINIFIYDQDGNALDSMVFDSLAYRHDWATAQPANNEVAQWFKIRIEAPNLSDLTIHGLDMIIKEAGMPPQR